MMTIDEGSIPFSVVVTFQRANMHNSSTLALFDLNGLAILVSTLLFYVKMAAVKSSY